MSETDTDAIGLAAHPAAFELTPAQRRSLRAKARHLHAVVAIGHHGLTPRVLHEIDVALAAHGLVKVRVFNDDRDAREALLAAVCSQAGCAPVQHLGKVLIVWRPREEDADGASGAPAGKAAATPRTKAARTKAGTGGRAKKGTTAKTGSRRRPTTAQPPNPASKVSRRARGQPPAPMDEAERPPRSPKAARNSPLSSKKAPRNAPPASKKAPRNAPLASKAPRGKGRGGPAPSTGPGAGKSTRASPSVAPRAAGRRTAGGPAGVPRAPNPRRRRIK